MSFFACFTELLSAGFNAARDIGVDGGKETVEKNLTRSAKQRNGSPSHR
jgi:hypothetical protein